MLTFSRFFFLIRFLDSFFSALLPISIGWLFHNTEEFARLEYINSLALIFSNFNDLGFSFYGFFGYKKEENKTVFMERYVNGCGFFSMLLIVLALLFCMQPILFFILTRTLYIYSYRYLCIYFNLKEKMIFIQQNGINAPKPNKTTHKEDIKK